MRPDRAGYFDPAEHVRTVDLPWVPTWRPAPTVALARQRASRKGRFAREVVERVHRSAWHDRHRPLHESWMALHARQVSEADLVLDALAIDLLLVPDETMDYNVPFFLASARAAGRRSLLVQLAVPSLDEIDGVLEARPEHHVSDRCQRAFAALFPRCLGRALAAEQDGLTSRHPWLSFSGGSDMGRRAGPQLSLLRPALRARRRPLLLRRLRHDPSRPQPGGDDPRGSRTGRPRDICGAAGAGRAGRAVLRLVEPQLPRADGRHRLDPRARHGPGDAGDTRRETQRRTG